MRSVDQQPSGARGVRSYGPGRTLLQVTIALFCSLPLIAGIPSTTARAEPPLKIVALGDSLTAGLGLSERDGFVARLRAALSAKGIDVDIANAGVSGDTAAGGLARLDWSVPPRTDAVILELGANDMLRGIAPQQTRNALDAILHRLTERHIAVLFCGMRAAPNLGAEYVTAFERIYPELAAKYAVPLYPFFLDGVAANRSLTQPDGLHPNAAGVSVIVDRILPKVEALIVRLRARPPA